VLLIKDGKDNIIGMVCKDMVTRKNIFYACSEMSVDEIEQLLKGEEKNISEVDIAK
jgi:hypothetical protein